MHPAAFDFVSQFATNDPATVIEIGSRDINGSVRPLFPAATWIGLDLYPGPGVDVVCDAETWVPDLPVDIVICCEVLEHARRWRGLLAAAMSWLRPGGQLIVTCAGPGRREHSHHDGGKLRGAEYYRNLTATHLSAIVAQHGGSVLSAAEVVNDTQVHAIRKA